MRSDKEEIPGGFTKEQANRAEVQEAKEQATQARSGIQTFAVVDTCRTYWPSPFKVCGKIREKYDSLGGPQSFLTWPKSDELKVPDGVGRRNEFVNGFIYWHPNTGAHPITTHFSVAWARIGWERGPLGYPTTDEFGLSDGIGRKQSFEHGHIYGSLAGLATIHGAIYDKWVQTGAEKGPLGYPTGDETKTPDGIGRFNNFTGGKMYWHPQHGAHMVQGQILNQWASAGYERGRYGYPVADPTGGDPKLASQRFEHGTLNSLAISVGLAGSSETFSIGAPSLENAQLRMEGDSAIIEDSAFLIRLNPVAPLKASYSVTFKDPTKYPEFRIAVGLPSNIHLESNLNSRVGPFNKQGREIASLRNPIANPSSDSWIETSTRVDRNEIVVRHQGFSPLRTFAAARAAGDSPEVGGVALGDIPDKWNETLRETERSTCRNEWNDCRRVFQAEAAGRAEALGVSIADPAFDNEGDAARHCAWQGLMTESANAAFAERMGNAHEADHTVDPGGEFTNEQVSGMDAYNNITGRGVGLRYEGNGDGVINQCREYALHARLTSNPAQEQQRDGSDSIVLKRSIQ